MRINIIGNGFDLYHGLPSSYYFFACYLINCDNEFYEEFCKAYDSPYCEIISHDEYKYIITNSLWSDFERNLSEVDEFFVVDRYENDLGLENDYPTDIEMNEYEIALQLQKSFSGWVGKTLDIKGNYELIEEHILNKVQFDKDDYFIVFNYTHTLEKIYGINEEKIYYIHGECFDKDSELIFGHGDDKRISDIERIISKHEDEYDFTQKSHNKIGEYNCLLKLIKSLKKDVDACIVDLDYFCRGIEEVVTNIDVYGMALGEVDLPYFKTLRNKYPQAYWRFSYYDSSEITRLNHIAKEQLNLVENNYELFCFINSNAKQIQNKIINMQNIVTY